MSFSVYPSQAILEHSNICNIGKGGTVSQSIYVLANIRLG
jgi:hypothetical protein